MNDIHKYLIETWTLTGWPFFGITHLKNKFGTTANRQLHELSRNGIIKKREGANTDLVELIKFE